MMVQIQQIDSWRSSFGSEMGVTALPQQQATSLDDDIPAMMVMQFRPQPQFKRPLAPPKKFRVKPTPPGKWSRMVSPAGSMQSSVHLGEGAADYSQRAKTPTWEQSPSPSAQDRQQDEHESRDPTKKKTPARKDSGSKRTSQPSSDKGSNKQKEKHAEKEKVKPMGRGRFDAYWGAQGGEQA